MHATSEQSVSDRILRSRSEISEHPPAGDYVVVDVTHFSTTVSELLGNGAAYVHITDERGDEFEFQERVPDTLIGGSKTEEYDPDPGYDFFNSPSYVQRLDVASQPTAMTSKNGGRAVTTLKNRGGDDVEVFVGGYTNAEAIAEYLQDRDRPTFIVAAGSGGEMTTDDMLGAVLIDRHLRDQPLSHAERAHFDVLLQAAKGPRYEEKHEIRQADLHEYATAINSRDVVPWLEGDKLVRAQDR
ncbi:2-phosphosulfolactate phosphatase [Haloferax mediterranei ATCC 33500]|uniref:2-phosphosulfolactate phosphatase n=1 Tax=Haloferax mediterranei (strain ATCC 33500 / DSM 1411 / JCM 8866 / NBRC 14739 / NCIMB 2177 / R-4) TaxID=523841 RepID=I3R230_HALMT|nr:2-phosphosulfolactate phosphatase [Haloferax mediterranei]AFK18290.1 2-phosphosulfolactate phosphatase [Haloferax mediterranei ATCC 33500]AHZ22309.1 2-phosphosulfolactate phosphatase [Haloferax mediterranei ATCC 33500]EMA02436.1 2-phosphosulfolactate phosphatase [Haloferax mediterranei ATCC 33500]MDX5988381.1 2-phosphosulfolactate phosphatase [Haloferax mediterranei ATCC 33500]QCQ74810.1 2-phosphosulfolactate phosphatase [Haloferax mediterranei ATCC 33500]